jgi:hypothetical protein
VDVALAAVVLAAGEGTRLRPLTLLRPKALCPVNNVPLLDIAIGRVLRYTSEVAVNVHAGREQMLAHLAGRRVHVSDEAAAALGTAGALAKLRDWLAGRAVLVANVDAWLPGGIVPLLEGWDGERTRLLVVPDRGRADFAGRWRYVGAALMPWAAVRVLHPQPSGLYEASWRDAERSGELELVPTASRFIDCGTPRGYLLANLDASGGRSVVGPGALVDGELVRSVVWPSGRVFRGERLVECVRAGQHLTVRTA